MGAIDKMVKEVSRQIEEFRGVKAIYGIEIEKMRVSVKKIDEEYDANEIKNILKKVSALLKEEKLDTLFIETEAKIFIKKVSDFVAIVVVCDKNVTLGNIYAMIKKILN
jgi:predicted regulator of Ras-like GTPase activity (Roadblock/LC7/MglB family)